MARTPLCPLVVTECDEGRTYIRAALMEIRTVFDAIGCVYNNFVVNDHFVSVAGPTGETIDSQLRPGTHAEPARQREDPPLTKLKRRSNDCPDCRRNVYNSSP